MPLINFRPQMHRCQGGHVKISPGHVEKTDPLRGVTPGRTNLENPPASQIPDGESSQHQLGRKGSCPHLRFSTVLICEGLPMYLRPVMQADTHSIRVLICEPILPPFPPGVS